MSLKRLAGIIVVGAIVVGSVEGPQPDPATADPAILAAAVVPEGAGARITYGFGAIGAHLVSGTVLSSTASVQQDLDRIRQDLKKKGGIDGDRARAAAQTANAAIRTAVESVYTAHPVKAIQNMMKAKNHLDIAKVNLGMPS